MTNVSDEIAYGDMEFDDFADGDSMRCTWDECVCTETPTHYVVFGEHAGGDDAQLFCARHYVLTLAPAHRASPAGVLRQAPAITC